MASRMRLHTLPVLLTMKKKVVGGKQLHNYKRNSEETKMTVTFDNSKGDYPNTVSLTNNVSL